MIINYRQKSKRFQSITSSQTWSSEPKTYVNILMPGPSMNVRYVKPLQRLVHCTVELVTDIPYRNRALMNIHDQCRKEHLYIIPQHHNNPTLIKQVNFSSSDHERTIYIKICGHLEWVFSSEHFSCVVRAVTMVWWLAWSTVDRQVVGSNLPEHLDSLPPPVVHDWIIKGLGMSSCVCATGYIKDPVALIEKSRDHVPVVGILLVSFIK